MRVPVSWLRELRRPAGRSAGCEIAAALVRAGLEVEAVDGVGPDRAGPWSSGGCSRSRS